jgi:predicted ATPase
MLKKLILENWKSFRYAELPIDPLTVLIGTNASGKSNALEALDFLGRIASGQDIKTALIGESKLPTIRGGAEWATLHNKNQFTLQVLLQGDEQKTDYLYSITIKTKPRLKLISESLTRITKSLEDGQTYQFSLFQTQAIPRDENCLAVNIYSDGGRVETTVAIDNTYSFLSHYTPRLYSEPEKSVYSHIKVVLKTLQHVFVLNPSPVDMRQVWPVSESLESNAANLAGVIVALPQREKAKIEEILSIYTKHLPERDIQRVWAESVGRLQTYAMLYCEEAWVLGEEPTVIDARGMSDGTLRFLAILTALLTRPEGSQLVIEEVDNGLHPSRADLLLKMLREIGEQRQIDVLVTTHNPALLNALDPEMLPFVIVAHRDSQTGESKLTPLEDLENLPKLMASGPLGKLAEQGSIERSLSGA